MLPPPRGEQADAVIMVDHALGALIKQRRIVPGSRMALTDSHIGATALSPARYHVYPCASAMATEKTVPPAPPGRLPAHAVRGKPATV
ncbi:hypothetical protein J0B02_13800 [Enterobacteriaceae bacterium YMB-R22]|uniref:hypothetical protein n=1 Tax=Tenebrionicola larvae TaxID=2815733 RepID=UPI002010E7E5|nr:hypothetical protein [Tenebrionicola larvae]MBV4413877.1 hypothetical protein [Tenebrionicola larvae]